MNQKYHNLTVIDSQSDADETHTSFLAEYSVSHCRRYMLMSNVFKDIYVLITHSTHTHLFVALAALQKSQTRRTESWRWSADPQRNENLPHPLPRWLQWPVLHPSRWWSEEHSVIWFIPELFFLVNVSVVLAYLRHRGYRWSCLFIIIIIRGCSLLHLEIINTHKIHTQNTIYTKWYGLILRLFKT